MLCNGLLVVLLVGLASAQVDVETNYGTVRGVRTEDEVGRVYDTFFGVPFAAPPVDDLRWQKPQPLEPWEDVLDAEDFSPHCTHFIATFYPLMGMSNETSEDCLYLNIYVPHGVENVEDLPVMVWYYGGAFFLGTAAMYPGQELALFGDVIVVGFNYRVSTLGWLSTGDGISPGNYGLWDGWAAVSWVKENIAAFGGDPERITIFGQSAGGSMVSHSSITPQMTGLFQRTIAISGASSGFFGVAYNVSARESTKMLGRVFRCRAGDDMQEIFDCLMEEDAESLDFWGVVGVITFRQQLPNWMPVVDGDFIPQHPRDSHEDGAAADVDFLTGLTHHDAAGFILLNVLGMESDIAHQGGLARTNVTLDLALRFILNGYGNPAELKDIVYEQYPDMLSEDNFTRTVATTEMSTDWWFGSGSHYEAVRHSRHSDKSTYRYDFHYRQSFHQYPDWVEGSHMDDLYSVFGEPYMDVFREDFLEGDFSDEDMATSNNVMAYYTNFAHTGDPNSGPNAVPAFWPEYDEEERQYMVVNDSPYVAAEDEEMIETYKFWAEEWPTLTEEPGEDIDPDPTPVPFLSTLDPESFEQALTFGVHKVRTSLKAMAGNDPDARDAIDKYIDRLVARREETIASREPY